MDGPQHSGRTRQESNRLMQTAFATNHVVDNMVIQGIDMDGAIDRLRLPAPKGKGWTAEEADGAVKWYKRFLALATKYPDATLVPSVLVDEVWHQHILDTRRYQTDCNAIFGHFFHHNPRRPASGAEEARMQAAFRQTNMLYRSEFGEYPADDASLGRLQLSAATCDPMCDDGE